MQQILDAILADAHLEPGFAALAIPESYRGVTVHKDEEEMFDGHAHAATRTRASPCTSTRCRCPSSAPARRSSP